MRENLHEVLPVNINALQHLPSNIKKFYSGEKITYTVIPITYSFNTVSVQDKPAVFKLLDLLNTCISCA